MPESAVLLFEDETILRLFPVVRRAWSLTGHQAVVPITGNNAKRVLFGAINIRTGHRILMRHANMRHQHFRNYLRLLRRCYPGRPIWLLLDQAPSHTAPPSEALARQLDIELVYLPKQCSELNAMDQLWRDLKSEISANYQFHDIDEHASFAEHWVLSLSKTEALRKASVLSKNFWLQSFVQ